MTGRIDEDDFSPGAEVFGLCGPHVAGHEQARPEHHGLAGAASADPHPPERGVDRLFVHRLNGNHRS